MTKRSFNLSSRQWDVIVVGAGHNGLACAAYLSKAGKRVLVLEARDQVGGACTTEEPYPGVRVSPCAYVVGLLHPLVINELKMKDHGFRWIPASGGTFVPFEDGTSLHLSGDSTLCNAEVLRFAPRDHKGWLALKALVSRVRDKLRPEGSRDIWIGDPPTHDAILKRLGDDPEAGKLLFEWSMVELLEHFIQDERLQMAYLGQGVIGTNASPSDPGTASIYFHHTSGRLGGQPGEWGYVVGGMGRVSFILCDIAREAGAVVATSAPVAEITPGEGVRLESGEKISAPVVVSNADPKRSNRLLGSQADPSWRAQVDSLAMEGCTVKVNLVVRELPNFHSKPGVLEPHHYGQINTPLTKAEFHQSHRDTTRGQMSPKLWTEIYLQTPHDPSIAPKGLHTMTVFSQFVPYAFADGSWDSRREEVGDTVMGSISRFCSNLPDVVEFREVLGPPDVERKLHLTGGHIFHGECLPNQMWDKRLTPRTPMPGFYLCGAGTFPGGSVMGINGRNAAMAVLADLNAGR